MLQLGAVLPARAQPTLEALGQGARAWGGGGGLCVCLFDCECVGVVIVLMIVCEFV